ncbi:unnamed protein product [Prorocentrum cordatum]|uniref:Uncharacterized protein n=1 Tax=Prorocentrum cordatum TaxID=2364126 RepID=A0ABN9PUZ2_9DINO|nr:unnamed protein product [Polarella glacialis]
MPGASMAFLQTAGREKLSEGRNNQYRMAKSARVELTGRLSKEGLSCHRHARSPDTRPAAAWLEEGSRLARVSGRAPRGLRPEHAPRAAWACSSPLAGRALVGSEEEKEEEEEEEEKKEGAG